MITQNRAWKPDTREWLCPGNDASLVMSHFRDAGVRVFVQGAAPQTPVSSKCSLNRLCRRERNLVPNEPCSLKGGDLLKAAAIGLGWQRS